MAALLFMFLLNIHTNAINPEEIYNCEPNNKACNAYNCTTLNALERSGFVCKQFPFYTGGWQWVDYSTYWNKEMQTSSKCNISTTLTQNTCTEWITSSTTHSNMNQTCICNSNTTNKCDRWECHSTENIKNNIFFLPTSLCQCLNYNSEICIEWNCNELYDIQHSNDFSVNYTIDNAKIYNATYTCLSDKPDVLSIYYDKFLLKNASFCWYWSADKINLDTSEWKISECECVIPHIISDIESYCFEWLCNERSMNYYHINEQQFYVGLGVITIAGGLILMCVFAKLQNPRNNNKSVVNKCCTCVCFGGLAVICLCSLLILCFVISGMCGIIVVMCVWILSIFVLCPLVKWLWKRKQESYWDEDELSTDYKNKKTMEYDFWPKKEKGRNVYQYEAYNPI